MEYLQRQIIGSCLEGSQYHRVRFLEAGDFSNFNNYPFRKLWQLIESVQDTETTLLECVCKTKDRGLLNLMDTTVELSAYNCIERYGLKLLEERFISLFGRLLLDLTEKSTDVAEMQIIDEYLIALQVEKHDIFTLSDSFLGYLGNLASKQTKSRTASYLAYMDNRIKSAKKVINEQP